MSVRASIAESFLALLGPGSPDYQVREYVRLAVREGVPLVRIAEVGRLPLNRVAVIAGGG